MSAKTSDGFDGYLLDENGRKIANHCGYVPIMLGGGDYLNLTVDLATGKILNWKAPDAEDLAEFLPLEPT